MNATQPTQRKSRWLLQLVFTFALATVAWVVTANEARADSIDKKLLEKAQELMSTLQQHNYENVGVLKFRVQKGDKQPSFNVGLLNSNMASRLEYALVLVNNQKKPMGITRDASMAIVTENKKADILNAADRKEFFNYSFPLAWGKNKVKVDAFLTGLVQIDPDFKYTKVTIECFDRKDNQLQKLMEFSVKTDRNILTDTGESFSLVKRDLGVKRRGDELDEEEYKSPDEKTRFEVVVNPDPKTVVESIDNLLDLQILYGKDKQNVQTDASGNRWVQEPPEGKRVTFTVRNKAKGQISMVLRVNGVNTLHKEGPELLPEQCTKWVLEPGKEYGIQGFYLPDNKVQSFQVVSPKNLPDLHPDKTGLIEVTLFRVDNDAVAERRLSLRGLSQSQPRPATLDELKRMVKQATQPKTASRGLILPGEVRQGEEIKEVEVKNLIPAGSMTIRYFR